MRVFLSFPCYLVNYLLLGLLVKYEFVSFVSVNQWKVEEIKGKDGGHNFNNGCDEGGGGDGGGSDSDGPEDAKVVPVAGRKAGKVRDRGIGLVCCVIRSAVLFCAILISFYLRCLLLNFPFPL